MITLTIGCMKSGKTESINGHELNEKILTCTPETRSVDIITHITHCSDLGSHYAYVDEAQFIDWTDLKCETIKKFVNKKGMILRLYGLDKWHDTSETSLSKYMKYHADSVKYFRARCDGCGEPATLTAKIKGNRGELVNEDKALYSPRCEKCYDVLCKKQAEVEERSFANGWGY